MCFIPRGQTSSGKHSSSEQAKLVEKSREGILPRRFLTNKRHLVRQTRSAHFPLPVRMARIL
ncbi:hypothetical protein LptCag_0030 [Leptospirillum ferriphilum]|uniref:Uncharacterized protein n=1 Tax=Leptospirillum ferriphilum TaxID=178606 RepID=A0A094WCN3_9BACT|nr:hypothetical protein LptCag_0030 [Leptospirillum ferriphilum]